MCKRIEGTCVKGLEWRTKLEYDGLDDSYLLQSDRKCEFQVVALNYTVTSLAKEYLSSAAEASPAAMKPFGVCSDINTRLKMSYRKTELHVSQ